MAKPSPTALLTSASVAVATTAALFWSRTRRPPDPSYLLELSAGAITVDPIEETRRPTGAERSGEPELDDLLEQAREDGRRDAVRSLVRGTAATISLMSLGALLTLVVLYGTGSLGSDEVAFVSPGEPVTQDDPVPEADPIGPPAQDSRPLPERGGPPLEQRPDPSTIRIPAIGVEASVIPLGTTDGVLDVPEDFDETGWWREGPEPGEVGPSVIVGHVDSFNGPAVFFQLEDLKFGDVIEVVRGDGSTAIFRVDASFQVDKENFPTEAVYGATDSAQLRLITCHGDFEDGSYLGNFIVTADLVEELPPPTTGLIF